MPVFCLSDTKKKWSGIDRPRHYPPHKIIVTGQKLYWSFARKETALPIFFFFYKFLIFNSTPNLYENRIFWNNSHKFFSYFPRKQHLFLHQNFCISKNKVVPPCWFIIRFFRVAWENCSPTPNDFDRCSAHRRREMFQEYLEKHWIYSKVPLKDRCVSSKWLDPSVCSTGGGGTFFLFLLL